MRHLKSYHEFITENFSDSFVALDHFGIPHLIKKKDSDVSMKPGTSNEDNISRQLYLNSLKEEGRAVDVPGIPKYADFDLNK